MATTTATLTLSSADLTGDALALSTTATLVKAGTVTGLTQFTGVGRKTRATTASLTLFDGDAYANGSHKVYLRNTSTVATEYFTIEINSEQWVNYMQVTGLSSRGRLTQTLTILRLLQVFLQQ